MSGASEKRFTKPSESLAHQSLLDASEAAGLDRMAVRRLLWLINAHPDLVAHAHIFQHIGAMLQVLELGHLGPTAGWGMDISAWRNFCDWGDHERETLATLPGLARFALTEKGTAGHPLLGEGVGRHGVVTALWSSHESLGKRDRYPPPEGKIAAMRYFYLQTQLLRGYIEGRWKFWTLEKYENYDQPKEHPIAPARTSAPTLAIREFSHSHYDNFLAPLDASLTAESFNLQILKFNGEASQMEAKHRADGLRYLVSLKRFFRGVARVMEGRRPIRLSRKREFGGGAGGHKWRAGFVPTHANGVYFENPSPKSDDTDFLHTNATRAWVNFGSNPIDLRKNVELSGLAPQEVLEPVLELIPAEDYQSAMQAERFKRLAIEASAQYFPWGLENLTQGEQVSLWASINQVIAAFYEKPPNVAKARYRLIAGLVLKFMLLFGQPIERARHLKIRWIEHNEAFDPMDPPEIDHACLYCRRPRAGGESAEIIGFGLPAIGPDYASDLDEELDELSLPLAGSVTLPDLSDLGQDLLKFWEREERKDDNIFGIEPKMLKDQIKDFKEELGKRFTPEKIQRILAVEIVRQTRDPVYAWLITADSDARNEPRMFYARKTLPKLWEVYEGAARSILRRVAHKPKGGPVPVVINEAHSVGARFVLRTEELISVCTSVRRQLLNWRREPCTRDEIITYNDQYIFYTYIFQSVTTSLRAISQPIGLMDDWIKADCPSTGFQTGISDKESRYFNKSRLVELLPELTQQFRNTRFHIQSLVRRLNLEGEWLAKPQNEQLLVVVNSDMKLTSLRPGWVEEQFAEYLSAKVPANFHRAYMRHELSERGIEPEIVDAFLGHSNIGESPFALYSTFDYGLAITALTNAIREIISGLGLEPIESRLVPYPTRLAHK